MRAHATALIPCFNNEDIIEDCLRSVSWADEVLVCDSFSTDQTLDIAKRYGARIVQHHYVNSATQKNWAIPQAQNEWVLLVDTDERIPPELRREIESVLASNPVHAGYRVPRRNHFF